MGSTPTEPQDHPTPMLPAHDRRLAELTNDYPGVAITPLAHGRAVLACRDNTGDVRHVEVIDRDGQAVDEPLTILGTARQQALALADRLTDHVVDHVRLGPIRDRNVSAVAKQTGIARQTLYNRLAA